jgi:hypothetical protein
LLHRARKTVQLVGKLDAGGHRLDGQPRFKRATKRVVSLRFAQRTGLRERAGHCREILPLLAWRWGCAYRCRGRAFQQQTREILTDLRPVKEKLVGAGRKLVRDARIGYTERRDPRERVHRIKRRKDARDLKL